MTAWIAAADLQSWLGADKLDSPSAASLAEVATGAVADLLERDLAYVNPIVETYDGNGTDYILLNAWPVVTINQVSYRNMLVQAATMNTPGWRLDAVNTRKLTFVGMGRFRREPMIFSVSYAAGYDITQPPGGPNALPPSVYQALRLTAAAIFNSQAMDPNLTSESTAGVFSGTFHALGPGAVPPGARSLLQSQIRVAP